jgi:hypothetical protein
LSRADRDYHGHRAEAMKHIGQAAHEMGAEIFAASSGNEKQALSDLQLRHVQMTLLAVGRSVPVGPNQVDVVNHINGAINQIALALESESDAKPNAKAAGVVANDPIGGNSVEVGALEQIYVLLSRADHDYKGHRVKSMRAIARAFKVLGGHIAGDGKTKENQATSDTQLRQAGMLLEQVRNSFAANDPKSVLADLTEAVNELAIALSIK